MNTTPTLDLTNVSSLLGAAHTHVAENRPELAAPHFERVLVLEPNNAVALRGMADIAMRNEDFLAAWKYAAQAAQGLPTASNITVLADISRRLGHPDKALKFYGMALHTSPNHVPALAGMAEVYEDLDHRTRAVECYEKLLAMTPDSLPHLDRLTKLSTFADSEHLLALYERGRPPASAPLKMRLQFQSRYITRKEAAERLRRNLPPSATSPDDLYVRFARADLGILEAMADDALAQNPAEAEALHHKGYCFLARGMPLDAEKYFRTAAADRPTSILHTVYFNPDFYSALESQDASLLTQNLPPVIDVQKQSFAAGPVIFLSCDIQYFLQFARPLLASINDVAAGAQVHVHIMNATEEELQAAKSFCTTLAHIKIAISTEDASHLTADPRAAKFYFHAVRFIRMFQYLLSYQQPLWLMDVDGLMNRDPRSIMEAEGNADIVLSGHAGRWEPWFQFNASAVGVRPTRQGIRYLRLVASYISHLYARGRLWWGIDQMALYGVFTFLRGGAEALAVAMLPPHALDGACDTESIVWTNGTAVKFRESHPNILNEQPDSAHARYLTALAKYAPV